MLHHENIQGVKIKFDIFFIIPEVKWLNFMEKTHELWKVIQDSNMGNCYGNGSAVTSDKFSKVCACRSMTFD